MAAKDLTSSPQLVKVHPDSHLLFVFISVYFSGWGRTIGGGAAADVLQQALLPVANHTTCQQNMKNVGTVYKDEMLCAGSQGKGGCQVKTIVYSASSKQISEHSEIDTSQTSVPYFRSVGRSVCPSVRLSVVRSFARSII